MAELVAGAFLSSFLDVTLGRLASKYFRSHRGLTKKLEITLNSINQVLDEAEQKQYQSVHVKKWLDELKHVVYEVDQLFDEIATHAQRKSKVRRFSIFSNDPFEFRIRKLLEELAFLEKQKDILGLKEGTCANVEYGVHWRPLHRLPTSSLMDDSSIYGRDADKEEIIKFLFSDNNIGSQVPILSIVGLGGMGKTTLAQAAYNDHRVRDKFYLKAWVFVSQSFDAVGLTKAILKSFQFLVPADCEDFNILQCELREKLRGRKYLIVLDDVWNGNGEYWERLLLPFNHGSSGSKIIVTTRDKEVASIMKSTQLLDLKQLKKSESWGLFVRCAFGGRNVSEYPNLESIGKKIVDKCGGLPLAVKTLGSLLQRKFSQREWIKILETNVWHLRDGHNNIINLALRLSYHNLPSNLKRCFSYCSIFPKGYEFDKDRLINCWMAEDLLKCHGMHKNEEELGNEFFDDLESISFFQQSVDRWGKNFFTMHDLVNDLAKSVSGEFFLGIEADRVNDIPKRTRHIQCLLETKDLKTFEHIYKIKGLRSLMVQHINYLVIHKNVQCDLFSRLKYLRMLSFCGSCLLDLADEIGNLKLLRYLDLSSTGIQSLPDSICKLYNLQTLILQYCKLYELPEDFHQLVNLRHLDLRRTPLKTMPKHMERLHHLQMLDGLYMTLEAFQPNSNLSSLTIDDYHGTHFPDWLGICHLPNLVSLTLKECKFCFQLPPLGQFPFLKELSVSICDGIEIIGEEFYGNNSSNAPHKSLEIVRFEHMSNWKKWSCVEGFPSLKELYIIGCPKLKGDLPQHLLSLQKLEIDDCPELEASIPKVDNIRVLKLRSCRIMCTDSCLDQILFNSAFLEELDVQDCYGPNSGRRFILISWSYNSLRTITIKGWGSSSLPCAPHFTNLHALYLENCSKLESFTEFVIYPNLVSLNLKECKFCSQLPPLGQLPCLKKLSVSFCDGIEIIGEEFYGNNNSSNTPFRSLEVLRFGYMSNWKKWSCLEGFPSLKELYIIKCRKLKGNLPQHLPSLQKLEIEECPELKASIPKADNIRVLKLRSCRSMLINDLPSSLKSAILSGNMCTDSSLNQILVNSAFVEELDVRDCYGPNRGRFILISRSSNSLRTLTINGWSSSSLPLAPHFTNLHALYLDNCYELESFPGGGLPTGLSDLRIHNCPKLIASRKEWGLFKLNSLKAFDVSDDFEDVESFPEESLLPPNLESLQLYKCSKLRTINYRGLLHLKSLNSLFIGRCDRLERLPVEEGSLNLLSTLEIFDCVLLELWYEKDKGEQWHTISHIPTVIFTDWDRELSRCDVFGDDDDFSS